MFVERFCFILLYNLIVYKFDTKFDVTFVLKYWRLRITIYFKEYVCPKLNFFIFVIMTCVFSSIYEI